MRASSPSRRRQSHSRAEIFLYQLAGIAAAIAVFWVWESADPAGSIIAGSAPTRFIVWWGHAFDARPFLLVSLALFTAWTLVGCYRQMRLELKMANGPLVWLGFLVFIGIYAAGFDSWLSHSPQTAHWDAVALRLGLAASTFATLTYIMVFLEPKDRVHFRWLGAQLARGRIDRMLWGLQSFMMSYVATALVSAALIVVAVGACRRSRSADLALIAAGLGFITRDVALFVLLHALPGRRRGDFTAVLALFALYLLIPAILNGLGLGGALVFFYPTARRGRCGLRPPSPGPRRLALVVLALGRIALSEKPARSEARAGLAVAASAPNSSAGRCSTLSRVVFSRCSARPGVSSPIRPSRISRAQHAVEFFERAVAAEECRRAAPFHPRRPIRAPTPARAPRCQAHWRRRARGRRYGPSVRAWRGSR